MVHEMDDILRHIKYVKDEICHTAMSCGRDPNAVHLIAVSKTIPTEKVRYAIESGVVNLGENYIQEAKGKIDKLSSYPVSWHFIGHLQSNKAKTAVALFDYIHTIDSLKLALELDKQAAKINKIQNVLIQVNISREETKSGVTPEDAIELIRHISKLDNLIIKGLMTMPPFFKDPEQARPYFKSLNNLREMIVRESIPRVFMDELSMGMTGDYKVAIQEGSTMVRVGTAIFGKRN